MYRKWFISALLLACLFPATFSQAVGQRQPHANLPYLSGTMDTDGVTLTWAPPEYRLTVTQAEGTRYSQIQMEGVPLSARPGYPQLPIYSKLTGLPPSGEVWLRVIEVERETVPLPYPLLPAPAPQPVHLPSDGQAILPTAAPTTRAPDPTVYTADRFYPDTIAQLGPPQWVRGRRVALLTIYPVRVNPVAGQMEIVRSLRLELTFERPVAAASSPPHTRAPEQDPFAQALASTLINPAAAWWQAPRSPEVAPLRNTDIITGNPLKVLVDEIGLYTLTYSDLMDAGLPMSILDPRTLRLTHGLDRQEIAILVVGESDGVFDPADRVLFYGEPEFSRFSDTDVYLLDHSQANGLRMAAQSGDPDGLPLGTVWRTALAETNQSYDSVHAGRNGDHWYWDKLCQPVDTLGVYSIWLDALSNAAAAPAAILTLHFQGITDPIQDPDHRVAVSVNDTFVGEITWNGAVTVEASLSVDASLLHDGENQITLSLPGIGTIVEGLWLDAFELVYPGTGQSGSSQVRFRGEPGANAYSLAGWTSSALSVYEVGDPATPRQVSGYSLVLNDGAYTLTLGDGDEYTSIYLVVPDGQARTPTLQAADILTGVLGADYVIITHPDLAAAVEPLAAHRAAQGRQVALVDVNAIYDTYGAGLVTPEAIHAFLQHIYPTYALLVGDGNYDFKDYIGGGIQNLIPPYLADVDPWMGETAADNRYACVDGGDTMPDLMLGRLPVKTAAEAQIVVDKIVQYETNPFPGDWNTGVRLVADDDDSGGNFATASDNYAASQVVAPFVVTRHYCKGASPGISDCSSQDTEALHAAILADWNRGALLFQFAGHSSWQQWAGERFFHLDDLPDLHTGYRLPILLEMTCLTASFHRPEPTLDESLVTLDGGGAVAAWGGTGFGEVLGHNRLSAGFHHAIFSTQVETVGEAILAAKLILAGTGQQLDLLDTYVLLGDPALQVNRTLVPWATQVFVPSVYRNRSEVSR